MAVAVGKEKGGRRGDGGEDGDGRIRRRLAVEVGIAGHRSAEGTRAAASRIRVRRRPLLLAFCLLVASCAVRGRGEHSERQNDDEERLAGPGHLRGWAWAG